MKANEDLGKYKTYDWLWNYEAIGLTKEHIKRLNNAINILESLNEHTDVKYLKEIKDKLLEVKEVKEMDLEKEIDDFLAKKWEGIEEDRHFYNMIKNELYDIAKHFVEIGINLQKAE